LIVFKVPGIVCVFVCCLLPPAWAQIPISDLQRQDLLHWNGVSSQQNELKLNYTPPAAGRFRLIVSVNRQQKLIQEVNAPVLLHVPAPAGKPLNVEAWLYDLSQQPPSLRYKSEPLKIPAHTWLAASYTLTGVPDRALVPETLQNWRLKADKPPPYLPASGPAPQQVLKVFLNQKLLSSSEFPAHAAPELPKLRLPVGTHQLKVEYGNSWSGLQSWQVQVTYAGFVPPAQGNYLLADKYHLTLYQVQQQQLKAAYPIAIGTPATPTPTGLFYLLPGETMPDPDTDWGVLRVRMFRPAEFTRNHWNGYALHGTNRPNSIGKEISLGCIRLFNRDIQALAPAVYAGMPLLVQERLPLKLQL